MADETKSLKDANPTKNVASNTNPPQTLAERNRQAALDRAKQKEEEQAALEAAWEAERKNDGRKHELEVEGFNIGDSLVRRMEFINEKAAEAQEQISEEDLEDEIDGKEEANPALQNTAAATAEDDIEAEIEADDEDTEPLIEEDLEDEIADEIVDEDDKEEDAPVEEESKPAEVETDQENIVPLHKRELPAQNETRIDDEDLEDIDLDDDDDTSSADDTDDNSVTDEELEALKKEINAKIGAKIPSMESLTIVDSPVSVNQALNSQGLKATVADWPLVNSGTLVSMSSFSGTDIDVLAQNVPARNRTNTFRDIYRMLYDHITSAKPDFETWLKETPFMDVEHYYMCAYRASFSGANYIPISCSNEKCEKVFLTDDVDMLESQVKFKDADAKKRFYKILESDPNIAPKNSVHVKPVSPTIAIGFREPSIYNTIFENAVLDQKFITKYEKLLTMMIYIDNIYIISAGGQARPIKVKKDPHSVAKSAKYRIATFAKIINNLPSDAYSNVLAEIAELNNTGDEVSYQFPEVTCPHCGTTIEAAPASATQLLFSRHRLNLLTAQ